LTYDTKVYVYGDAQGTLVACNDDGGCGYSGYQSYLWQLALSGGTTYYLVVDGYGDRCGTYYLWLAETGNCVVECPPGASVEGEPSCEDGYEDSYNGGCRGAEPSWTPVEAGADGCATVCGRSCTYLYNGLAYRDEEWYEATAAGGPVTVSVEAEFLVDILLDPYTDCGVFPEGAWLQSYPCIPREVTWSFGPGARLWLRVTPSVWEGVAEAGYVFRICGLSAAPTPVKSVSWGRIKDFYRGAAQ
jgi:hypothetical protein